MTEPGAPRITLYTIGFTKKNARAFFGALLDAGVTRVVDVRLNNTSQLAGFAKRDDLTYFLQAVGGIGYIHLPQFAPSEEILDDYKKKQLPWPAYEERFLALMARRNPAAKLVPAEFDRNCLLCSEAQPDQCHRRLVAEYLRDLWGPVTVKHLG